MLFVLGIGIWYVLSREPLNDGMTDEWMLAEMEWLDGMSPVMDSQVVSANERERE